MDEIRCVSQTIHSTQPKSTRDDSIPYIFDGINGTTIGLRSGKGITK